ncbi:hypothetical protein V1282_000516 [Nitrobacteraceae bacterium AZCC 2146]|jgi:hypothetical protein
MAKVIGELLFGIFRILAEDLMNAIFRRTSGELLSWLGTKVKGRAAIIVGLLLGFAAYFFPIAALLLAH